MAKMFEVSDLKEESNILAHDFKEINPLMLFTTICHGGKLLAEGGFCLMETRKQKDGRKQLSPHTSIKSSLL